MGETTSPGDAAQLALWLAQLGHTEFLDDAERIVRARILPSQIVRPLGVRFASGESSSNLDPETLGPGWMRGTRFPTRTDPEALVLGAFGGMHTHPHGGILPTTDVTAADLHTLCDICTHIVETDAAGVRINFHFDYRGQGVECACREQGTRRALDIRSESGRNLLVRIPRWADRKTVALKVNGAAALLQMHGDYACLPGRAGGGTHAVVEMDLPVEKIKEWTHDTAHEFTWVGDTVRGITPNAPFLPFYPTTDTNAVTP